MKTLSVVIPVYNSQNTIKEVVDRLTVSLCDMDKLVLHEIILVNDASVDNSLAVCKNICTRNKSVKLISLSKNFGQHNALLAGFRYSSGEYTASIDDDLEKLPEDLIKLINTLEADQFDVVYGIYSSKKQSELRNLGTHFNDIMATHLINKPKKIKTSSFLVFRKFILDEMLKYDNAFPYIHGLIFRTTQNVGNVDLEAGLSQGKRIVSQSNYTLRKLIKLWLNGFTNYSIKPLRALGLMGFIFSLASFLYIIFIILQKIFDPQRQMGWTSLMAVIVFFGGVQLISIGMLGEYIGRVFLCINKTPQYVIKESANLEKSNDMEGGVKHF